MTEYIFLPIIANPRVEISPIARLNSSYWIHLSRFIDWCISDTVLSLGGSQAADSANHPTGIYIYMIGSVHSSTLSLKFF